VRWFDDLAAVVTFLETDPVLLVDLSDPRAPKLRGELKVPGYSAYLHPVGDSRLLGIGPGPGADEFERLTGHQAEAFDISQPTDPRLTGALELDSGWPTQIDPRAFTYLTDRHLAIAVMTVEQEVTCTSLSGGCRPGLDQVDRRDQAFAISVDPAGELHLAGRFTADQGVVRVLPVAGRLFAVTDDAVYLLDPNGLTPISSAQIAPPAAPTPPAAAAAAAAAAPLCDPGHCPLSGGRAAPADGSRR
jgi:hypothetical protein